MLHFIKIVAKRVTYQASLKKSLSNQILMVVAMFEFLNKLSGVKHFISVPKGEVAQTSKNRAVGIAKLNWPLTTGWPPAHLQWPADLRLRAPTAGRLGAAPVRGARRGQFQQRLPLVARQAAVKRGSAHPLLQLVQRRGQLALQRRARQLQRTARGRDSLGRDVL